MRKLFDTFSKTQYTMKETEKFYGGIEMLSATYRLIMKSPPTPGKIIDLVKDEIILGREASCDVTISDAEVSRRHARMYLGETGYILTDLGSTNGTFVNDVRLSGPHLLQSGEIIRLGPNVVLEYEATVFDPNATVVGPSPQAATVLGTGYAPASTEPAVFAGQIPAGPAETGEAVPAQKKTSTRTWILAGCGCLLVVCCVLGIAAYLFDKNNLYCTPMFKPLFSIFGVCP